MINKYKIVDFETYCPQCKYQKRSEEKDPCNDCLAMGANIHTDVPIKFEEKKKGGKKRGKRT